VFAEHGKIVEAIKAGNLGAVRDAVSTHIYNTSIHHYKTLDKVLGQKYKEQYEPMFRSLDRAYKSGLESSSSPKSRARKTHGT
jgi:hypothetical protein